MSQYNNIFLHYTLFLKKINKYLKNIKILDLRLKLSKQINYKEKPRQMYFTNLKNIVQKYNKTIKLLEVNMNKCLYMYNEKFLWNIKYINFEYIKLRCYDVIVVPELYHMIVQMKNSVMNIYKNFTCITKFTPKFKLFDVIKQDTISDLIKYKL